MFSGIRYILGYTDEADAASADASATSQASSVVAPSTVLEQTLNAATTKFTEQLLPQQSSIEQLQSSSHQLLPSITEQHEENELKKQASLDEAVEALQSEAIDEDDSFVADSWELLDLVENVEDKPAVKPSRSSSVQKDETTPTGSQKSTNGILKSSSAAASENSCQQSRHKPKVSFETPDLVSINKEIEQTKATDTALSGTKKGKAKKNKRNSKASASDRTIENHQAAPSDVGSSKVNYGPGKSGVDSKPVVKSNKENPSLIVGTKTTEATPFQLIEAKPIEPTTLNYAKALLAKPKSDLAKKMNEVMDVVVERTGDKNVEQEASKPMKRNRPTSTSSWSSGDEIETVEKHCAESALPADEHEIVDACIDIEDDNLSLASSGFSDCDYGFGGINDYVMRPKKSATRRSRTQSSSSGIMRATKVARGHLTKHAGAASSKSSLAQGECSKSVTKGSAGAKASTVSSTSMRNSKPKKKKLILTVGSKESNLKDFLKPSAAEKELKNQEAELMEPKSLKPVQQSPASSSNDSNEIPEMDESWYVTPPPCFTGTHKQGLVSKEEQQPKALEAARENALIEHPSIYIASSSKNVAKTTDVSTNRTNKKASRQSNVTVTTGLKKAWNNKFNQLIDDWDLDGQEDAESDFDSMFETVKKKKNKSKRHQKKLQPVKVELQSDDLPLQSELDSDDLCIESTENVEQVCIEAPNSVELISIRSLSMENSLDIESEEVNSFLEDNVNPDRVAERPSKQTQAVKVRPIEPERRPGWQLKKQRSKRRPLISSSVDNRRQSTGSKSSKPNSTKVKGGSTASESSSSRSTPTFMDRIGSSIVANLTNLTNGLVSSGALNSCSPVGSPSPLVDGSDRAQQSVATRSKENNQFGLNARKQLSRVSLKRQNATAQQANMQRRPDRRLKMFATPNGSSVNRKVHANIH